MEKLLGKKVLLFSPFGTCKHYTDGCVTELESRGAEVRVYDERPSQASFTKIYMYLFKKVVPQYFFNYIRRIVTINKDFNPDIIFVIRGQGFDVKVLKYLHRCFPKSTFIFFQWDPLCGKKIPEILKQYDYVYSFDTDDVINNPQFKFRPLFFLKEYQDIAVKKDYSFDVSFVGTLYNNRWGVIKIFQEYFGINRIISFFFLYMASWTLYLWDFIRRGTFVSYKRMQFKPMSYLENVEIVRKSKCILDIVYSEQSGLSPRPYEAMAANRKYITNNAEVMKYDFYDPDNILVVNLECINIPKEFLFSDFKPVDPSILYRYSLPGFVDEVFSKVDKRVK